MQVLISVFMTQNVNYYVDAHLKRNNVSYLLLVLKSLYY